MTARPLVFLATFPDSECDLLRFLTLPGELRPLRGDVGWAEFTECLVKLQSLDRDDERERDLDEEPWWYRPHVYLAAEELTEYRSPRRVEAGMYRRPLLVETWSELWRWAGDHFRSGRSEQEARRPRAGLLEELRKRGMVDDLRLLLGMLRELEAKSPGIVPELVDYAPEAEDGWPPPASYQPRRDFERLCELLGV
jgi:hypothetical protein